MESSSLLIAEIAAERMRNEWRWERLEEAERQGVSDEVGYEELRRYEEGKLELWRKTLSLIADRKVDSADAAKAALGTEAIENLRVGAGC